ncbi:hypothetical protein BD779DRAFT_1175861 [Infundibulicybe gibba]|nr:hypothetical protein BD779DRAFT_1175861 [Infundibulicybe gibba]
MGHQLHQPGLQGAGDLSSIFVSRSLSAGGFLGLANFYWTGWSFFPDNRNTTKPAVIIGVAILLQSMVQTSAKFLAYRGNLLLNGSLDNPYYPPLPSHLYRKNDWCSWALTASLATPAQPPPFEPACQGLVRNILGSNSCFERALKECVGE